MNIGENSPRRYFAFVEELLYSPRVDKKNSQQNVKTVSDKSLNVIIFHTFTCVNLPDVS